MLDYKRWNRRIRQKEIFFQKRLYGGLEISVYVVSSESWTAPFDAFWFDEFIYILHGKGVVHLENEDALTFSSGEYFFTPKGFPGKWEVQAGDNYHYELSVITNRRADSSKISTLKTPILLDLSSLSGVGISFDESEFYSEVLADGIELDVTLFAEQPRSFDISTPDKEQLICIQSGIINITDTSGEIHTFLYRRQLCTTPWVHRPLDKSRTKYSQVLIRKCL